MNTESGRKILGKAFNIVGTRLGGAKRYLKRLVEGPPEVSARLQAVEAVTPKAARRRSDPKRTKALAVSWYFVPYVGSADVDFFRRIKDLDVDFDVLQVSRGFKDEKLLEYDRNGNLARYEINVDYLRARSEETRRGFAEACLRHFEQHRDDYAFIISHSNEVHCHRVAYEIRRRSGLPWIAYFGDPSARNPYVRYMAGYPFWEEDNESERLAFEHADLLVFNNEYQRRLMLEGFSQYEGKSRVVHHAYDPEMYPKRRPAGTEGRFVFSYFGTLYSVKRKGDIVFRAVDRLLEIYPGYAGRFVVDFYGSATGDDVRNHSEMKHRDHVVLRGQIPYTESLSRMMQADVLLLIDAFFSREQDNLDFNPFLSCKLTDYMGAMRPIAGITMEKGLSGEVLKASGNLIADERIDRIAYVLKRYIDGKVDVDYSVYRQFSHERQVAGMQKAVDELLSKRDAR